MNAKVLFYCRYCRELNKKCMSNHRWGMLVTISLTPDFVFVFSKGEIEMERFIQVPNVITGEVENRKSSGAIEFEKAYRTTGGWYSIHPQVVENKQLDTLNLPFRVPVKNERIFIKKLLFDENNAVEFAKVLKDFESLPEELEHIEEYINIFKRNRTYYFSDFEIKDIPDSYNAKVIYNDVTIEIPKVIVYKNLLKENGTNYEFYLKLALYDYKDIKFTKKDNTFTVTFFEKVITIKT